MTMSFTSRIPARTFGLESDETIPGLEPILQPPAASAQVVAVDPCHVFDEVLLRDMALWWSWHDTSTPLYISGPTGCGKTSTVLQFLARVNAPVISVTCSRRFLKDDLVGRWGAAKGGFVWFDGPATLAWKTGAVLVINEFSLAPAEVWVGANDIFEGQPITIEKTGESVCRHPNARVIITDNCRCGCLPEDAYESRNQQDASTCDRFWHITHHWPEEALEAEIVRRRCRMTKTVLADGHIDRLGACAARFAAMSRQRAAGETDVFAKDRMFPVSTRVVLRVSEILVRLLEAGLEFDAALERAVRLAIGGALTDASALALFELASFCFASLKEELRSGKRRSARKPRGSAAAVFL